MNETGLSVGGFWLPTTVYQQVPQGSNAKALAIELIGKWILGNFSNVAEVKQALSQIYVWEGNPLSGVSTPPLHMEMLKRELTPTRIPISHSGSLLKT